MTRVLLIDSVAQEIELLTRGLLGDGHEVLVARHATEALEQAAAGRPDVTVLDLALPDHTGISLCRQFKASTTLHAVPVIVIASRGQESHLSAVLDSGAHDYVTRPLQLPIVLARIRAAERSGRERDRRREPDQRLANPAGTDVGVEVGSLDSVDPLTSARSRGFLDDALRASVSFSLRHALPLSLLMLDIDNLQGHNEELGTRAGDDILRAVAGLLRGSLRSSDVVARYDGDAFAILLPATDSDSARSVAQRLRSRGGEAPLAPSR